MNLVTHCRLAITDSGGVQEETTYLGIPCATLRENTERPITVTEGSNRLLRAAALPGAAHAALEGNWPSGSRPERWDGRTSARAVASLRRLLGMPAIDDCRTRAAAQSPVTRVRPAPSPAS